METKFQKIGILDGTDLIGTNNVKSDTANASMIICLDNTTDPIVEVLPPMPIADIVAIDILVTRAEVTGKYLIGGAFDASSALETPVASTRYALTLQLFGEKYESWDKDKRIYAYTMPAVLTGSAATDRYNLYSALVDKINADSANHVTAYLCTMIAVVGASTLPDVGSTLYTGAAWTGILAGAYAPSGTWAGDASALLFVYNESGVSGFAAGADTIDKGSLGGTAISTSAVHTRVAGQAIVIVDDAGYFPARPSTRKGPGTWFITQGFSVADIKVGTAIATGWQAGLAPIQGRGIGSRLLTEIGSFGPYKESINSGEADFILRNGHDVPMSSMVDSSESYDEVIFHLRTGANKDGMSDSLSIMPSYYRLFLESDHASLANLKLAINTVSGKTARVIA